jgi:hypothetical protein
VKRGTRAGCNSPVAADEASSASGIGRVHATEVVAENKAPSSKPVRVGGAGSGVEPEEEDSERQQPFPPQAQQVQVAFKSVVGTGAERTTGAQTSNRLNRMASGVFTEEI